MKNPTVRQTPKGQAPKREGRKASSLLRWNIQQASREFGSHREALERRRRALNIEPGADECYSTRQIAQLIFGDKEAADLGKVEAERRKIELNNARSEGELVPTASVSALIEQMFIVIRQKICSSGIPKRESDEILEDLVAMASRDWAKQIRFLLK